MKEITMSEKNEKTPTPTENRERQTSRVAEHEFAVVLCHFQADHMRERVLHYTNNSVSEAPQNNAKTQTHKRNQSKCVTFYGEDRRFDTRIPHERIVIQPSAD